MGVTSNYSFPVPVATDLVKDGWDAINDLGVAVDTAMNTALGTKKAGMVLLNTTSFSAVASVSLATDTFTTTYDRYKVFFTVSSVSTNNQLQFRLRKAGTNSSTGYYYGNQAHRSNNTANNYGGANDPAWFFYDMQSAYNNEINLELTVNFPATSTPTSMFVVGHSMDGSNNSQGFTAACAHRVTDTYDSASFFSGAGATMTGSYSVFGINK